MIADRVKPEAKGTVAALRRKGLRVCMLTGDNRRTAEAIAQQVTTQLFLSLVPRPSLLPAGFAHADS